MAISSIQMFQNNGGNSIEGLLRAGPQAISEIMNQAIQIGRQMSDKQLSQEKDLLNMRQQENAMMQRRGENAQQLFTDTMKFNRDVGEDNRDYAANRSDRAFDQNRQTANDLFSQRMEQRRLGLSEQRLGAAQSEAEAERKRKAEELLRFNEQYGGEPAFPSGSMEPNPEIIANEKLARDETNMIGARSLFGVKDEAADTRSKNIVGDVADQNPRLPELVPSTASDMFDPEEGGGVLPSRNDVNSTRRELFAVEEDLKNPNLTGEARVNAKVRAAELEEMEKLLTDTDKGDAPEADKGVSPTKLNSMMKTVEDLEAFAPQSKAIALKYGSFEKAEALAATDEKVKAEVEAAKQFDANRFNSEKEAALSAKDENDYVEKAYDITTAIREKRRKFYREVVGVFGGTGAGGSTTTGSTATGANSPLDVFYQ